MTTATNGTHEEGADSRFGGLAAVVEKSIASSIDQNLGSLATDFFPSHDRIYRSLAANVLVLHW